MSHVTFGHIYTKKIIIYLKFRFNWTSCIFFSFLNLVMLLSHWKLGRSKWKEKRSTYHEWEKSGSMPSYVKIPSGIMGNSNSAFGFFSWFVIRKIFMNWMRRGSLERSQWRNPFDDFCWWVLDTTSLWEIIYLRNSTEGLINLHIIMIIVTIVKFRWEVHGS